MKTTNGNLKILFSLALVSVLVACNRNTKFTPIDLVAPPAEIVNPPVDDLVSEQFDQNFTVQKSSVTLTQESLEQNRSTLSFQVKKADGSYVQDLSPSELVLSENKNTVHKYNLTKNSFQFAQTADIVFVVDVTGSMSPTIEAAKIRLINFIKNSRQMGYHSRMCLVTFGDYTIKKCQKFYDNDPSNPATQSQVDELISEITQLKALTGAQDPGGRDLDENPMRALIDASESPWQSLTQRFAILVTDAGFLYSPGNEGDVGKLAPQYSEVKTALQKSQMKVFAATQSLAGYNKKFRKEEGIVNLSGGEWFNFADLVSGKITLDTILNRIIFDLNTTFVAEYVVEEQPNLDATLPLKDRAPQVELKNPVLGAVISVQLKSNLPDGRKAYPKEFKIADKKIKKNSVRVYVNSVEQKNFTISDDGRLVLKEAPAALSEIKIDYQYEDLNDTVIQQPLVIPAAVPNDSVELILNGIRALESDYSIKAADSNYKTIQLSERVFSAADPYKISEKDGLKIKVSYKKRRQ